MPCIHTGDSFLPDDALSAHTLTLDLFGGPCLITCAFPPASSIGLWTARTARLGVSAPSDLIRAVAGRTESPSALYPPFR
jgi:hypothetical protein